MPVVIKTVQRAAHCPAIPDALAAPAQLLAEMNAQGVLEALARGLQLSRRGGYTGLPLLVFALAYLAARTSEGLRPFSTALKQPLKRVGAVAGCSALPSSGSVSRALGRVPAATAATFADVALSLETTPELDQVLSHPSVVHRDSRGEPLHVIDIDPTVQAFRLRDLIESDDHPEPERLSPGVPGYTGHHRGEVRVRHVAACHAGAGVWLSYRVSDDNPHLSALFSSVVSPAISVLNGANVPTNQILVRGDAELGTAGVARAIVDLGVQLLVRIARYRLLDRPEIQRALRVAGWEQVPSGGVRVREATELGMVMLHPSSKSADAGRPGVPLRVVAARRKVETSTVSYGTLRHGYQYELFATTLSWDAWSAADIVELYGGRSAIENRFAQEDRELGLGRTFSYHAPGQAVFTAVGLFLWNYWTCAGFLASPPPDIVPEATPRPVQVLSRAAPFAGEDPAVTEDSPAALAGVAVTPVDPDLQVAETFALVPPPIDDSPEAPEAAAPPPTPTAADPMDPFPDAEDDERGAMVTVLRAAYRDQLRVLQWSLDPAGFLRCPNNKRLFPFSIGQVGPARPKPQVIIRTDVGACDGCPLRTGCYTSARPNTYKQISRALAPDQFAVVSAFLARNPPGRAIRLIRPRPPAPPPARPLPVETPSVQLPATEIVRPPELANLGPWTCSRPTFPAAPARQRARARHANVRVEITISRRKPQAPAAADPRRARRSWSERDNRWRLHASVRLTRYIPRQPPKKRAKGTVDA